MSKAPRFRTPLRVRVLLEGYLAVALLVAIGAVSILHVVYLAEIALAVVAVVIGILHSRFRRRGISVLNDRIVVEYPLSKEVLPMADIETVQVNEMGRQRAVWVELRNGAMRRMRGQLRHLLTAHWGASNRLVIPDLYEAPPEVIAEAIRSGKRAGRV
ncbi:hypothetical protein BURK2_00813 [Burkholderiales bacterium]|nr:MAG: hypothetical protein F9K47_15115 [Burkholderiales bacterium]CAG0962461.1 hypothetical protein BURK2_00813 [Burkholderiales bacterium]